MLEIFYKFLFSLALLASAPAVAQIGGDLQPIRNWPLPLTKTVDSANGEWRLTVKPAQPPEEPPCDPVTNTQPPAPPVSEADRIPPLATMARRGKNGEWKTVWEGPLVNRIAPAQMLVADNGAVITLDNWFSLGRGENVIVIYDRKGRLVRSMPLTALVPQGYMDVLPISKNSVHWYGAAEISEDGKQLLLHVLLPPYKDWAIGGMIPFAIALKDGAITPPPPNQWQAMQAMRDEVLGRKAAEAAAFAERMEGYRRRPLTAPAMGDSKGWHYYLTEAHLRLTPDWPDVSDPIILLLEGGRAGPIHSRRRLTEAFAENAGAERVFMIAALSFLGPTLYFEHALSPLPDVFSNLAPGSLAKTTVYIVAGPELQAQLQPSIIPSGAQVIWLDPTQPIPQRTERIPGSAAEAATQARTGEAADDGVE